MALAVEDILVESRRLLQDFDPITGYRWSDDQLLASLRAVLGSLYQLRPDFWFGHTYTLPTTTSAVLPLPDWLLAPIAQYLTGLVEMADDQSVLPERAGQLYILFRSTVASR